MGEKNYKFFSVTGVKDEDDVRYVCFHFNFFVNHCINPVLPHSGELGKGQPKNNRQLLERDL